MFIYNTKRHRTTSLKRTVGGGIAKKSQHKIGVKVRSDTENSRILTESNRRFLQQLGYKVLHPNGKYF